MVARGLAIVVLAVLLAPTSAPAQTLVPPACVIASCDEEKEAKKRGAPKKSSDCRLPATMVCAGSTIVGAVTGAAGDVAGAGLGVAGDAVMGGLTDWVGGGAAWLLNKAARLLERSSRPALGSTWFREQYRTALGLAVSLSLVFLLCAILQATLRHDVAMLAKSALVALPLALLLCFAAVTLVETALAVTDWMTVSVLGRFERDTGEFFSDVAEVLVPTTLTGNPLPSFLLFLGGLLTALTTFVVWLELVMREAAVYVAVAFLPLCFASMIWQRTAHWSRRLVELLAAVILAKFTIATAVALAAGAMAHGRPGEGGLTALMAGSAVMLIAALTPWLLLRVIPIAEAAGHLAIHRSSVSNALAATPGAGTASMAARQTIIAAAVPAARVRAPLATAGRLPTAAAVPLAAARQSRRSRGEP